MLKMVEKIPPLGNDPEPQEEVKQEVEVQDEIQLENTTSEIEDQLETPSKSPQVTSPPEISSPPQTPSPSSLHLESQLEEEEDRKSHTFKHIIKEIIDTEQDYVNDLSTLQDVHILSLSLNTHLLSL